MIDELSGSGQTGVECNAQMVYNLAQSRKARQERQKY